jgi:hypothetical protein
VSEWVSVIVGCVCLVCAWRHPFNRRFPVDGVLCHSLFGTMRCNALHFGWHRSARWRAGQTRPPLLRVRARAWNLLHPPICGGHRGGDRDGAGTPLAQGQGRFLLRGQRTSTGAKRAAAARTNTREDENEGHSQNTWPAEKARMAMKDHCSSLVAIASVSVSSTSLCKRRGGND